MINVKTSKQRILENVGIFNDSQIVIAIASAIGSLIDEMQDQLDKQDREIKRLMVREKANENESSVEPEIKTSMYYAQLGEINRLCVKRNKVLYCKFKEGLHLLKSPGYENPNLLCPCCGRKMLYTATHSIKSLSKRDICLMEKGITCTCGIKSTYDFDKEIIKMESAAHVTSPTFF